MAPTTNSRSPNTRANKSPKTRGAGKNGLAASKKAAAKTVVKKPSSARKAKVTKTVAATEKKDSATVHLKANDVPIVRGNGVLAVALRKALSESSAGRKKWDTATRQAVDHFDGKWDAKKVVPYVLIKLGKTSRFLCTNGDESSAASASSPSPSKGSTHVWHELSQEQIISACQIKFNRIKARMETEEEERSHEGRDHADVDMMEGDNNGKKKATASLTPPPGAVEGSAGEATAEGKKATSSSTAAAAAAEPAAPPAPTFFDRVRGFFGWGTA
jgi:hypothetical protein